jgi:uncharacterized membrane protein YqhA
MVVVAALRLMEDWLDALTPLEHLMFHLFMIGIGFVAGALVYSWLDRRR